MKTAVDEIRKSKSAPLSSDPVSAHGRKVKKQKRPIDQSVRRLRLAVRSVAPYNFQTALDAVAGVRAGGVYGLGACILAYMTGMVDQELLGRNEYLAVDNP